MKLIYRGVSYEYHPQLTESSTQAPHSGRSLIYRGQTYHVNSLPAAHSVQPASYTLVYRGTTYQVQRSATGKATVTPIERKSPSKIPNTLPRRYIVRLTANVHQKNLLANLRRRLKVAQAQGDRQLIAQLESEHRQLMGLAPELW